MKILQIKNWQFLLVILTYLLVYEVNTQFYISIFVSFIFTSFLYYYLLNCIALLELNFGIKEHQKINIAKIILTINYLILIFIYIIALSFNELENLGNYLYTGFLLFAIIFTPSYYFIFPYFFTKQLNSAEQKREVKVIDHKLDLLLAIFWFVGFLFFMPRINKLYLEYLEKNKSPEI